MTDLWPISAILFSLGISVYALINQQIKASPVILTFWRNIGVGLVSLPALFFIDLPTAPVFYFAVLATGIFTLVFDITFFKNAADFGAGVVSRLLPIGVILTFIIWAMISSQWRNSFLSQGITEQSVIILSLVGCTVAVMMMNRSKYDLLALKRMIPVIFSVALVDVFTKIAMDHANLISGIITYICLQGLTAGFLLIMYQGVIKRSPISVSQVTKNGAWKYGLFLIMTVVVILITKTAAINGSPNPSYVSAIGLLSPFWVDLFNQYKKIPDPSNRKAGFVVVLSVAVLIIAAA